MFDALPAAPQVDLTYAHPGQSIFRCSLIRVVEALMDSRSCCGYILTGPGPQPAGVSVFAAALRQLQITPDFTEGQHHLQEVPSTGSLLLVTNNPFGVVDGLTIGHLGMQLRSNVRILTNSLLCRVSEVDPYLLTVDFSGIPEARRLTAETRRRATDLLASDKVVANLGRRRSSQTSVRVA